MYKAVIFDLDGTLLDTSRDIHKTLNTTLRKFSLPRISLEKTLEYVGNGAKKLVERAIPAEKLYLFGQVAEDYMKRFAVCDNSLTTLYEGEEDALKKLKERGVKLAIVTNKPQAATEGVYNKHLARFDFDFVAGQNVNCPLKPDPALAFKAAKAMGVDLRECLFVGDGETDVQTAKNAGMDCVAVLWGYRSKEQLKAAGAPAFAENYAQLVEFVLNG